MALLTSGSVILTVNLATGETRRTSNAAVPHLTAIAIWLQQNPGFLLTHAQHGRHDDD